VERAALLTPFGARLAAAFWPGPLSIILEARSGLAPEVLGANGSVAIRVPASETARQLARAFGHCLTSTSANLSGQPATADPAQVATTLGERIDYLLDTGCAPGGEPSTIVDARGTAVHLVRAGAVPWERVLESLK
jgi:L-threonylcarbamoyladenylate synthase